MKIKEKYYRFAEKGQQIQRVNRFLVTEYLIFYAFILFMLWASRAKGVRSLGFTAFVSVIAVVSGGALLIGWKRRPESERLRYLALIGLIDCKLYCSHDLYRWLFYGSILCGGIRKFECIGRSGTRRKRDARIYFCLLYDA